MWHPLRGDRPASFRSNLLPLTIAVGSGLLMGLAPAPLNLFPLAWVALAPLWVLITERSIKGKWMTPVLLALAWGIGYHGLALSWITGLHPLTWLGVPWLASIAIVLFCWGFITLWGAALVIVWAWLLQQLEGFSNEGQAIEHKPPFCLLHPLALDLHRFPLPFASLRRVLVGTALWCGLEWFWSLGPLGWTSLAYTQSPGNLALLHLGQLSGTSGVTAAIVAVNGLLAEVWMSYQLSAVSRQPLTTQTSKLSSTTQNSKLSSVAAPSTTQNSKLKAVTLLSFAAILLIAVHLLGYALYARSLSSTNGAALKVGIIQGNVPTRIKLGSEGIQKATKGYTNGYETLVAEGVDAVLTPEGALPFLWNESNRLRSPLYQAVLERGTLLWLGTFTAQNGGIARSLVAIASDGTTASRYDKIKLVPLGEYIPFQNLLGGMISILSPITENGQPGAFRQQFETPFGRAIASICYDSAFPEVFRSQAAAGGQFILTASNLDPYSEVLMAQHQAQDIMRAIETDRWAVRATNTGYSGFVTPHGHVEWRSQPHTYQTHVATIFRRQTQTLYVRWGDWLTPLLVSLGAIMVLFSRQRV
ncbi:apolipoprotein N-acyltransferase [Stenomitos frigidus]|uniref:Apolipoprotein N-acyltransferase n=1 Tax=Stenomitos frigidus ULC18 TaxID=2107698 RepID=A0A2T1DTQ1_9CYAN|nr:apolipoprotein N-acyltransferase [Stenomitos frigidus]PSB23860.1 apolipoprotein N-acyltransferase [Stenomitos frigidus ULC18]